MSKSLISLTLIWLKYIFVFSLMKAYRIMYIVFFFIGGNIQVKAYRVMYIVFFS